MLNFVGVVGGSEPLVLSGVVGEAVVSEGGGLVKGTAGRDRGLWDDEG